MPAKDNHKIKNRGDDILASSYHFPEALFILFTSSLSDTCPSHGEAVPRPSLGAFPPEDTSRLAEIVRFPSTCAFITYPRFSQPCELSLFPLVR